MHTAARKRLQLSGDLRRAVAERGLTVKYQPLVRLTDGHMLGAEALVRWPHETLGEIQPDDFIGLAEETGLIVPIGRFVLEEACRQLAVWLRVAPDRRPDYVSVNLSARQFQPEGQIVEDVRNATRAAGVDPAHLMLEITESVLMNDPTATAVRLHQLKRLGVQVAIDDFGTGYSSLSYLRQFPVDSIKIDRSFLADLGHSPDAVALLHSLIQLGKNLGLVTFAEGIELESQMDLLREEQCDAGQGYLFAHPLTAEAAEGFFANAVIMQNLLVTTATT
jgi:EAL domain-containing protein (putative c-di-GMP-specific phosphodiesterase class I)